MFSKLVCIVHETDGVFSQSSPAHSGERQHTSVNASLDLCDARNNIHLYQVSLVGTAQLPSALAAVMSTGMARSGPVSNKNWKKIWLHSAQMERKGWQMDVEKKRVKNTTDFGKADMKRLKDLSTALMSTENTVCVWFYLFACFFLPQLLLPPLL